MTTLLGQADPENYQAQLDAKNTKTKEQFHEFWQGDIELHASPASHYRMRAEFKIWQQGSVAHYAMYQPGEYKKPVLLDWEFSIGAKKITELMPSLLKLVNDSELLRKRLFQVEFLTTTTGDSVTTLIYHKPLTEEWLELAKTLESKLDTQIIGRSKKQKLVLQHDYVEETLTVSDIPFTYKQIESGFTQPNAQVCQKMLQWAVDASHSFGGDLVELYCGNGNFTLPLSKNFDKILATEVSKTSVKAAEYNIQKNACNNIKVVRMSSEEFTEALNGVREFRRLKDIDLTSYAFSTVFVDPPRAGLDKDTEELISQFDNIIYISCNPDTLKTNLEGLCKTHSVERFALFDQFPYTDHRECGVILRKR